HYFSISLYFSGIRAQVQLRQPQSVSVQYGGEVRLSCNASGYQFTNYGIAWLRQIPSKEPVYMGYISPYSEYIYVTQSFIGRFNINTDNSRSMAYLDIRNVQLEDAAVYYCARDPQ
ncbi:hypothetical protein GDO78_019635, partial [Eleutherodactylus coqui]